MDHVEALPDLHIRRLPAPRRTADARTLNALTIDVEDYYHVSAFESFIHRDEWDRYPARVDYGTRAILDLLAEARTRATFFVLGWLADRNPRLVRAIHDAGHEIGCHSYWHRLVYAQTPDEFRADLRRGRDVLENTVGEAVRAYRAPSFSITRRSEWALDILIEEGFTHDSSIYPTYHHRYGMADVPTRPHVLERPSGRLVEFPMPVMRRLGYPLPVGGGGYFRLYPYWLTRHGLRSINRQGQPFVVYVHPWELDPQQPRMPAGRLTRFRHYVNLSGSRGKLARLLQDFRFGTLTEAVHGLAEPAPLALRAA